MYNMPSNSGHFSILYETETLENIIVGALRPQKLQSW